MTIVWYNETNEKRIVLWEIREDVVMKNSKKYLIISIIILLMMTFVYLVKVGVDNKVEIEATEDGAPTVFVTNTAEEQAEEVLKEEIDVAVDDEVQEDAQDEVQEKKNDEQGNIKEAENAEEAIEDMPIPISVQGITTTRLSKKKIQIMWSDRDGDLVEQYILKKRDVLSGGSEWRVVQTVSSDLVVDVEDVVVVDELAEANPQQYEYRVDVVTVDESQYAAMEGRAVLGSNLLICIDPGHYVGKNAIEGEESYGYVEGEFMLELAFEVRDVLKENYGIDSMLTRETPSISLGGYTDEELDTKHISLRGEYAAQKDCDLFVSLHTNGNSEFANGYDINMQPIALNKPLILVNALAISSKEVIRVSNSIGTNLSKVNYELGISEVEEFVTVETNNIEEWTQEKNEALNTSGTVYCRWGSKGDFYGVLRGAANVNKPGILIEHGFHTIPEVRREAMQGDLKERWAQADAYGIAYGYGFVNELEVLGR